MQQLQLGGWKQETFLSLQWHKGWWGCSHQLQSKPHQHCPRPCCVWDTPSLPQRASPLLLHLTQPPAAVLFPLPHWAASEAGLCDAFLGACRSVWADIKQTQKHAVPEEFASCKLPPAASPGWSAAGFSHTFRGLVSSGHQQRGLKISVKWQGPMKLLTESN